MTGELLVEDSLAMNTFISQPYSFSVMADVFFSVYSFRCFPICFSMQYWHSEQHGIFLILVVFRLVRKEADFV